jgi:iron complex transport system substrate-binding protein
MRIASLVPSATEMLFAAGLGDSVVAVTHECDHPPAARSLPQLTRTVIPPGLGPAEIDAEVKRLVGEGRALYELDEDALTAAEPDLIVTQAVCDVCAVSYEDVAAVAARLPGRPEVLRQDPSTLAEMLEDVTRLGEAAGAEEAAAGLRGELEGRLAAVEAAVAGAQRPGVLALEWLDPPFVGGHWVPEMIDAAGGEDVAGRAGEKSRESTWEELTKLRPDLVVVMPCGWYVEDARAQALAHGAELRALGAARAFAVDAASSFSRPGPRLVDGTELLAHLLHPELLGAPRSVAFAPLGAHAAPA